MYYDKTYEELDNKKAELISYLAQLLDLKRGYLKELVLERENKRTIELLEEAIGDQVAAIDECIATNKWQDELEREHEEKTKHAHCTKCREIILGDEDSRCGNCV